MIETVSNAVTRMKVKYRRWRLPQHAVHRSTNALFDECIAELEAEGQFSLDDLHFTETPKEDARDALYELEEKGFLASVEGESDTWKAGELLALFNGDVE